MARNSKYDWPDDQTLQALLDELGTVETARQVGCPPRSLSNRIRRRGLRASKQQGERDAASGNGKLEAAQSDGGPEAASANGEQPAAQSKEKPRAPDANGKRAEEPVGERKPASRIWEVLLARPNKAPGSERKASKAPIREPKPSEPVEESKTSEPVGEPKPSEQPGGFDAGFGNDDSSSAQRASHLEHPLALLRRVPPPIWRLLAVVGLAAVAAAAAFISVGNDPKTYQRESSFAVRPSSDVPPAAVNDVLGTLAQPDSAITETIVNMLGSPRLRDFAARSAGIPASSVGGSGAEYEWSATRRTGSTIIDVRLTGPNDDKLLAMQTAAAPEAARLVEESYSPYRLETLSAPSPPVQVGPKTARTVGLALLLGALLGVTLVLVERRLRSSLAQREGPARAPAERGESWGH
jgi:capsular polysaccharide biosynthesis protein